MARHTPEGEDVDVAGTTADSCAPLAEEIETLEDQVAVLEEGLPGAPGAQRAALAKEIMQYREEIDARQSALRRCQDAQVMRNTGA